MQILPNGLVQIQNASTGESRVVKPEDLASYSPGLIAQYQDALSKQARPNITPSPAPAQSLPDRSNQQDLATTIGKVLGGLLTTAKNDAVGAGKTVAGQGFEIARGIDSLLGNKNAYAQKNGQANIQNPFIPQKELNKTKDNPIGYILDQMKPVAGAASYAVPFGGGANIISKALLPGAIAGGLQGASQENATPESVAGNAVIGAGGAGALHGLLGIPGIMGKAGNVASDIGKNMQQDVNKIQLPASVYGAGKEKSVQETVNALPGLTADQKYANLQPTMQNLGDTIQAELQNNPKVVRIDQVKGDLMANLQDQLRTKNLSSTAAKNEIDGYLQDLYHGGFAQNGKNIVPDSITTENLFKLKQQVNQDYSGVSKKIQNGAPLNDREKVIAATRQTLDDVIANAHPNVKQATKQQSHLYDAANSLSQARNVDHGTSIFGLPIPGQVVQGAKSVTGQSIDSLGGVLKAGNPVEKAASNPAIATLLSQGVTQGLTGNGANNNTDNANNPNANGYNNPDNKNGGGQLNQNISSSNSISQDINNKPITKEMVTKAYLTLAKTQADRVKSAYDAQYPSGQAPTNEDIANSTGGLRDLSALQSIISSDPNILLKKTLPGAVGARQYKAAETDMLNNFIYLKTGKQASDAERRSYESLLPQPGEPAETINAKLKIFNEYFNQRR